MLLASAEAPPAQEAERGGLFRSVSRAKKRFSFFGVFLLAAVVGTSPAYAQGAAAAKPATAAEQPASELPSDYVIGPDDLLGIVFWRDTDMTGDVTVRPDGMITLPIIGDSFLPDQNPQNGLAANRSLVSVTSASVRRNWSRKTSTQFEYRRDRRTFDLTPELDNRSRGATLSYERALSRSMGVSACGCGLCFLVDEALEVCGLEGSY